MEHKRLFFGFEVAAPWPESFPPGRVLLEKDRHLTIAFLGDADLEQMTEALASFPGLPYKIGLAGVFDRPIFLPHQSPHVAAWSIRWLEGEGILSTFQKEFFAWLKGKGMAPKESRKDFLPHVTLARSPFAIREWKEAFEKRPLYISHFCLYESLGSSRYEVKWTCPALAPFEEKEHTADIAYLVRGLSMREIHCHAQLALSFRFPPLVNYFSFERKETLDEIIESLNQVIGRADEAIGCPFKAASYSGKVIERQVLEWEMIIDV